MCIAWLLWWDVSIGGLKHRVGSKTVFHNLMVEVCGTDHFVSIWVPFVSVSYNLEDGVWANLFLLLSWCKIKNALLFRESMRLSDPCFSSFHMLLLSFSSFHLVRELICWTASGLGLYPSSLPNSSCWCSASSSTQVPGIGTWGSAGPLHEQQGNSWCWHKIGLDLHPPVGFGCTEDVR